VDFDMTYGHRNDIAGYARALTAFDKRLGELLPLLKEDDLLIITADHGCDPSTPSTDHSREYTPMLAYGDKVLKGKNLGTKDSFADIGATVLEWFGVSSDGIFGKSFFSGQCRSNIHRRQQRDHMIAQKRIVRADQP
jgi:phosphopentomutase